MFDFALSADGKTLKYSVGATRAAVIAAERAEYDRGIHIDDTVPVGQGGLFRSGNFDGRLATQRFRSGAPSFDRVQLLTGRSEEHTSELQSLMRISDAVFCLKKKQKRKK